LVIMATAEFYSSISSPLLSVVTMVTSEFLFLDLLSVATSGNHDNFRILFLNLLSRTAGGDVVSVTSNRTHVLSGSAQLEVSPITPSSSPRVSDIPVVAAVSDEGDSMCSSTTASSIPNSSIVSPDLNVAEVNGNTERSRSESTHQTMIS